jgi:hypothetical protein
VPRSRRALAVTWLGVAFAFAATGAAGAAGEADATPGPAPSGERVWSLLAVGDLGARPWSIARSRQVNARVARALTAEDQRAPVDALVLLGDNFYPSGLERHELDARVRGNLAEPLCRFLPSPEVACPVPSRPARVLAVLGNHDHIAAESPALQRVEITRRLPSFRMPAGAVEALQLGSGVSLVLYDGHELYEAGDFGPLLAAVRASPGPWRILASHHPLTRLEKDHVGRAAREAIAGLDVPVHLHLAGHRHYLEIAHTAAPPFLQAIAGSGSNVRVLKPPVDGSRLQVEQPGFARVDLVRGPAGERLVVSLAAIPAGRLGGDRSRVVARWSVDLAGAGREEPLPAAGESAP